MAQKLKFNATNDDKTQYGTESGDYTVSLNEDGKTWSASNGETSIVNDAASRAKAQQAAQDHATKTEGPDSPGENTEPVKSKPAINSKEFAFLELVNKGEGAPVSMAVLSQETGTDFAETANRVTQLARKGYVNLTADGSTLTETGVQVHGDYTARISERTAARKPGGNSEGLQKAMEEKYGPRPEGIGPRPTHREVIEARLANAQASLAWSKFDQRLHPYSPIAARKVANAQTRVDIHQAELDKLTAEAGDAPATKVDEVVTETSA